MTLAQKLSAIMYDPAYIHAEGWTGRPEKMRLLCLEASLEIARRLEFAHEVVACFIGDLYQLDLLNPFMEAVKAGDVASVSILLNYMVDMRNDAAVKAMKDVVSEANKILNN